MEPVIRSAKALGASIRKARRAAGLTQTDLGLGTGLRQATISSLENGEGGTLESLFKLCTFLKLEMRLVPRSTMQPELDEIF
jgi:HTH-type transcriptional regulator/antitoxin HipB